MFIFLISALVAIGFAVFALQNNFNINIAFGEFQLNQLPLFVLAIIFFTLGIIFAWVLNIISELTNFFLIQTKAQESNELKTTLNLLIRRLHLLETEFEKIKKSLGKKAPSDDRTL